MRIAIPIRTASIAATATLAAFSAVSLTANVGAGTAQAQSAAAENNAKPTSNDTADTSGDSQANQSAQSSRNFTDQFSIGSSRQLGSARVLTNLGLSSLDPQNPVGSAKVPDFIAEPPQDEYPLPFSDDIQVAEIVSIAPDDVDNGIPGVERWTVASPSMGRNVELQVIPAKDPSTPAPNVYLLDGVGAPRDSEWVSEVMLSKFEGDNVNLIMPTQAFASNYMDWVNDDPVIGRAKWETFLAQELPPLLETSPLNQNGKYGVIGVSMGATGAVNLANRNPQLFDAVAGISGCYSTMTETGRASNRLTVETRHGSLDNLFGPYGSQAWVDHDVAGNPEGLRNMKAYFSAARGELSDIDLEIYKDQGPEIPLVGTTIEVGSYECTKQLQQSMKEAGMDNAKFDYSLYGAHNWANFTAHAGPAWQYIRTALY